MVAPNDGTVASIDCAVGDGVEAGDVLATLN
jgi:biotin carboxyl carrier protein